MTITDRLSDLYNEIENFVDSLPTTGEISENARTTATKFVTTASKIVHEYAATLQSNYREIEVRLKYMQTEVHAAIGYDNFHILMIGLKELLSALLLGGRG